VIPLSGVVISGTAPNCLVKITPAANAFGLNTLTFTVSDGENSTDSFFTLNIVGLDDPPTISTQADIVVYENQVMSQIDFNDLNGGDTDVDGETITYTCKYDETVDSVVGAGLGDCTSLSGLTFSTVAGTIDWTPTTAQDGSYEIEVTASDGTSTASTIFVLTVADEQFFAASNADTLDRYGQSVAVSENNILVGAFRDDTSANDAGAAYLYQFNSVTGVWDETLLLAADGAADDFFGKRVSISGNSALIGAIGDDDGGADSGAAYLFQYNPSTNNWDQLKLTASDAAAGDSFGTDVSISDNNIIIGALGDDDNGATSGSAYLFQYNSLTDNWIETKLTASDGAAGDQYGNKVAVSDNNVIIGAISDQDNGVGSGSAYIYQYNALTNSWVEKVKLVPSDGAASDNFGSSVAISGNRAIVGAWKDDDNGAQSGSAYIFEFNPVTFAWDETKLVPTDGQTEDQFGIAVGISGSTAIVGAWLDDQNGANSGAVYEFQYNASSDQWVQFKRLAGNGQPADNFGYSVAIHDHTIAVGAIGATTSTTNAGAVSLFQINHQSTPEVQYQASDAAATDYFGQRLSISGNILITGSPGNDDAGGVSGSAYILQYNPATGVWDETKITASDAAAGDWFGIDVAVSGTTAVVGAYLDDDTAADSGSAYIYQYNNATNLWVETKLNASDAALGDEFGNRVAVAGNTVVVCAHKADPGAIAEAGAAYIYQYNPTSDGWDETKIVATGGAVNDFFCQDVDISGNNIIIGDLFDDDNGAESGSAWLYQFNPTTHGWDETKFIASDAAAADEYGAGVAISGNNILIGAPIESGQGAAYLYQFNPSTHAWDEKVKLVSSDIGAGDHYSRRVSLWGNQAGVGTHLDDDNGLQAGAAYLYRYNPTTHTWVESKYLASDGDADDQYGSSLVIGGNKLVIGAFADEEPAGAFSGTVYFYEF
jgi:hypothetical protein